LGLWGGIILCRETTENTMSAIWGLKATITYLNDNRGDIIDNLLTQILANKKSYLCALKDENIYTEFRDSLINGHFQWMIDFSHNPDENQVPFDGDYTIEDVASLSSAYCDFYTLFAQFIDDIDEPIEVQENLEDYCTYLSTQYCG